MAAEQSNDKKYDSLHDLAMALPSIYDLKDFVKLPQDNNTHLANLEKVYADARAIIIGLIEVIEVSTVQSSGKTCGACHGSGRTDDHVTSEVECSHCEGSGVVQSAGRECRATVLKDPLDHYSGTTECGVIDCERHGASQSATTSITPLVEKVAKLADLKANWDSYGAEAFPERTVTLAMEIAATLDDEWKCVPCADGPSVCLFRGDEEDIIEVRTNAVTDRYTDHG